VLNVALKLRLDQVRISILSLGSPANEVRKYSSAGFKTVYLVIKRSIGISGSFFSSKV